MPVYDERNILKIGPDKRGNYDEITLAMVEACASASKRRAARWSFGPCCTRTPTKPNTATATTCM